jgi:hypothetical protein
VAPDSCTLYLVLRNVAWQYTDRMPKGSSGLALLMIVVQCHLRHYHRSLPLSMVPTTQTLSQEDYTSTGPMPSHNERHHRITSNTRCGPELLSVSVRALPQGGGKAARQIGQPASALISIQRWRQCEWKKWLHGVSIRVDARATCKAAVSL